MRAWGVVCVLAVAGCYHGASELPACTVTCAQGCPDGTSCVAGYCTSGADCAVPTDAGTDGKPVDAGPDAQTCGFLGGACCASGAACGQNLYCNAGTCSECVLDVALGSRTTCVREHDGTVHCVGFGTDGELGNNAYLTSPTYVQVVDSAGPITNAKSIAAGRNHTCMVRTDGTVWCWGYNGNGELGNGSFTSSPIATQVVTTAGPVLNDIAEVSGGLYNTCARSNAGNIWCWGYNFDGELGDGGTTGRATAAQVTHGGVAITGAVSLGVSGTHACMRDSGNQVWCWGYNLDGRVGDGTVMNALDARVVASGVELAVGRRHACVRQADGTAQCWGDNRGGNLGDGTLVTSKTPKPVLSSVGGAPINNVAKLVLGRISCAITTEGEPLCWGGDAHGSGIGSPTPVAPVTLGPKLTGIDRMTLGWPHACAHASNGAWMCWGRNSDGELGDNTTLSHSYAIPLSASCQ